MDAPLQLRQARNLIHRKSFRITDSGVRVDERTFFGERSYTVAFESISNDGFVLTRFSKYAFWFFVGFGGAGGLLALLTFISSFDYTSAAITYSLVAIVFGIRFLLSRVTYIGYRTSGDQLMLFKDNPTKQAVESFLTEMQQRKHDYLMLQYGNAKPLSPAEELQRLAWLREKGTISAEEFLVLKQRVMSESIKQQHPLDNLN